MLASYFRQDARYNSPFVRYEIYVTIFTLYVTFAKYLRDITYYSEFTDKRIYVALYYYIQFLERIK